MEEVQGEEAEHASPGICLDRRWCWDGRRRPCRASASRSGSSSGIRLKGDRSSGTMPTLIAKEHDMHRRRESVEPSFLDCLSPPVHFARRVWRAGHLHAATVQLYPAFYIYTALCMLGWGQLRACRYTTKKQHSCAPLAWIRMRGVTPGRQRLERGMLPRRPAQPGQRLNSAP
jgi:hypothetical protein